MRTFMDRCVVLILALAAIFPAVLKSRPGEQHATRAAFSAISSQLLVAVSGDVPHPGIYPLAANAVTGSVILLATPVGGRTAFTPQGIERIPLRNGSALHLVRKPDETVAVTFGSIPVAQRIILGIPLDVNAMSEADFEAVPGIGPVLAKRILVYRQLNGGLLRPEDLQSIEGIGKVTYYRLLKYF